MLSKWSTIAMGVLALTLALSLIAITYPRAQDFASCEKISQQSLKNQAQSKEPIYQNRLWVTKHIWFSDPGKPRSSCLVQCQQSTLVLNPDAERVDILEKMYKVQGWVQDGVVEKSPRDHLQQIRHFEAVNAIFSFKEQQLTAQDAQICAFEIPGEEILHPVYPSNPLFIGKARQVSLLLKDAHPLFEAKDFEATIPSYLDAKEPL